MRTLGSGTYSGTYSGGTYSGTYSGHALSTKGHLQV